LEPTADFFVSSPTAGHYWPRGGSAHRCSTAAHQVESDEAPRARKKRGTTPEVGQALRAAYQQAVSEDIPPEMLDLLGKLG
jgi:hypothetical protein